jgi:hypothetical protein
LPCPDAYSKRQKNDFRDAEAITEAVQRLCMKFAATKTADQLDLQALHRVRERLVSQRTGIINQIRAFLLERGIAVRQGQRSLRAELPRILATPPDVLSPRMVRVIEDLAGDFRRGGSRCRPPDAPNRAGNCLSSMDNGLFQSVRHKGASIAIASPQLFEKLRLMRPTA